jgi:drug/metabolite transporter (DMT)-like permease
MSPQVIGFMLMVCAALFGGSVPAVSKIVLEVFPPITTLFLRVLITTIIFALIVGFRRERFQIATFRDLARVSLLLVVNTACAIFALRFIPSALVPILYATSPLMTLLIQKYENPQHSMTTRQLSGIGLGFVGVLVAISGSTINIALSPNTWIGVGLILLGSFCFSLYGIRSKSIQKRYSPTHITLSMTILATLVTAPFALFDLATHHYLARIELRHILALFATGAIGTVAFYMCYQYAIKHTNAQTASMLTYIQPPFAVALSVLLVGESITPIFIIGSVLAIAGASLASKK